MRSAHVNKNYFILGFGLSLFATNAMAMTLDWSGYLRADTNTVQNYQIDAASPGYSNNTAASGEYIKGQGDKSANFSSVFMKLKPKLLVNDNVIIHSEWNVGDPIYGMFGQSFPSYDDNNPTSSARGTVNLSVARLWLDTHTDFGTLQVGRAPMHWGLGAILNSGDGVFDRYQSTVDTIRLVSKFSYLTFMPFYAKDSMGRNIAGAVSPGSTNAITLAGTNVVSGSDDVTDYGLALKYENPEEDLEGGVIYYKREASDQQNVYFYPAGAATQTVGANGMSLKLIDVYLKKAWTHLELKAEVPIYSGTIGDENGIGSRNNYQLAAFMGEANLNYDSWKHGLKFGTVPGQAAEPTGNRGSSFGALYLNRDYKLGMILFNYNLNNFGNGNPDTIVGVTGTPNYVSPYDESISNAKYLAWASEKRWEQWALNFGIIFAKANHSAVAGQDYFSESTHTWGTAVANQGTNLGWEVDVGTHYNWDDNISFGLQGGIFNPGSYYSFINTTGSPGNTNAVKAVTLSAATSF
jgi:hypothetical protein